MKKIALTLAALFVATGLTLSTAWAEKKSDPAKAEPAKTEAAKDEKAPAAEKEQAKSSDEDVPEATETGKKDEKKAETK